MGIASTPDGNGYWATTASGQVVNEGDAANFGSITTPLRAPIVGISATPSGNGYWLVASDGGVFSFGDAQFFGSTGGMVLNKPVVGMASTSDGSGYWLVASDGGVFSFGDAQFFGSTGGMVLNKPVVGMAATSDGNGYWLVASDGGVFTFGDAPFFGSTGSIVLNKPVVGITATADNGGYRMVASDGGIFDFGDAAFFGSGTGAALTAPVVGMAARPGGYWIVYRGHRSADHRARTGRGTGRTGLLAVELVARRVPVALGPSGDACRRSGPGQNGVIAKGAIMAFESVAGLATNGAISTSEMARLAGGGEQPDWTRCESKRLLVCRGERNLPGVAHGLAQRGRRGDHSRQHGGSRYADGPGIVPGLFAPAKSGHAGHQSRRHDLCRSGAVRGVLQRRGRAPLHAPSLLRRSPEPRLCRAPVRRGVGRLAVHDAGLNRHRRLTGADPGRFPPAPPPFVTQYGVEVERLLRFDCNAVAGWLHLLRQVNFSNGAGKVQAKARQWGRERGCAQRIVASEAVVGAVGFLRESSAWHHLLETTELHSFGKRGNRRINGWSARVKEGNSSE